MHVFILEKDFQISGSLEVLTTQCRYYFKRENNMMPQSHTVHVMETCVFINLFPFVAVIRGELFAVTTGVLMKLLSYASSLDI